MEVNYNLTNDWLLISGESIPINDFIKLKHYTVREILEMGEFDYYSNINMFVATPKDYMVELFDEGTLYTDVTNWDLFIRLFNSDIQGSQNYKKILGNYDFTFARKTENDQLMFWCKEHDFVFDELIYMKVSTYMKHIHDIPFVDDINPSRERNFAEPLIRELVKDEKYKRRRRNNMPNTQNKGTILRYVDKLVWGTGRSYNDVLNMTLYQFKMGIKTISNIKIYDEVKLGYFTGNLDSKKVRIENYDWLNK